MTTYGCGHPSCNAPEEPQAPSSGPDGGSRGSQEGSGAADGHTEAPSDLDLKLVVRIQKAILDEAANWTETFDGGIEGAVVSVSDAAYVAARVAQRLGAEREKAGAENALREAADDLYAAAKGRPSGERTEMMSAADRVARRADKIGRP